MESRAKISNSVFSSTPAIIRYENNQLIFLTKSKWTRLVFGVIGEAMASAKERFRIDINDVESVVVSNSFTGKSSYEITLQNGENHKIVFNADDSLTNTLKNDLKDRIFYK